MNKKKADKKLKDDPSFTFTSKEWDLTVAKLDMCDTIWHTYHTSEAHMKPGAMVLSLRRKYFFLNLVKWCKFRYNQCDLCAHTTGVPRTFVAPLKPLPVPRHAWDRCHIDCAGPFPTSQHGIRFFVVTVDPLTSYPEANCFPTKDAENIVLFMHRELWARYGVFPLTISDNGMRVCIPYAMRVCIVMHRWRICQ